MRCKCAADALAAQMQRALQMRCICAASALQFGRGCYVDAKTVSLIVFIVAK
jgi:hypothetical protein